MPNELADATLAPPAAAQAPQAPDAPAALPSPLDAVQAGQIPAITLTAFDETNPLHEFVVSNFDKLNGLGLDYVEFGGKDHISAIFNPQKVTEAQLKDAYKSGKLEQIAPVADTPAPASAEAPPAPEAALSQEAAPTSASAPLANASVPASNAPAGLQEARARNLQAIAAPKVNTPTGGPLAANSRRAF